MYKVLSGTKRIGSNGGTLAGLVGSYGQVIERIQAFHDAGIELFMLQFQPLEAELDRFADKIIPRFPIPSWSRHDRHTTSRCRRESRPRQPLGGSVADAGAAARDRRDAAARRSPRPNGIGCCSTTPSNALAAPGVLGLRVPAEYGGPGGRVRDVLAAVIQIGGRQFQCGAGPSRRTSASPSGC